MPQRMGAIPENMMGDFIHANIFWLSDHPEDLVILKIYIYFVTLFDKFYFIS